MIRPSVGGVSLAMTQSCTDKLHAYVMPVHDILYISLRILRFIFPVWGVLSSSSYVGRKTTSVRLASFHVNLFAAPVLLSRSVVVAVFSRTRRPKLLDCSHLQALPSICAQEHRTQPEERRKGRAGSLGGSYSHHVVGSHRLIQTVG